MNQCTTLFIYIYIIFLINAMTLILVTVFNKSFEQVQPTHQPTRLQMMVGSGKHRWSMLVLGQIFLRCVVLKGSGCFGCARLCIIIYIYLYMCVCVCCYVVSVCFCCFLYFARPWVCDFILGSLFPNFQTGYRQPPTISWVCFLFWPFWCLSTWYLQEGGPCYVSVGFHM
jgi:hypothetical protein